MSADRPKPHDPVTELTARLGLTMGDLLSLPDLLAPGRLPEIPRPEAPGCWPGLPFRPATPPKARPAVDLDL